ncbi:hypothetical protein [Candidatus Marithrix sp. Canyon 246]|uniref:hypothetical protein n=1 Tax=Candidatus Marithrix sp. Canyon 246 TaxID=1827136 RepID=UPI000849F623|nr:hypothetical protein [Candidatus Marithrix sp. Canyon 246]
MTLELDFSKEREPLIEYPWYKEVDHLLEWVSDKDAHYKSFCFDLVMSLAYIDAISGLERLMEFCDNCPDNFNAHIGFINLCCPCYEAIGKWSYQKAAKPQSGALGKLSSELILRFILKLSNNLKTVLAIGGTEAADAILIHKDGTKILAEVKSAPLITYPVLFEFENNKNHESHEKVIITASQLKQCQSAIYLHNQQYIPLGMPSHELWPFKQTIDYIVNPANSSSVFSFVQTWLNARDAYIKRDKNQELYYLANASGNPPKIAKTRDGWPRKESISDSKTSAGMDRTDDIKKGIYQVLKIGSSIRKETQFKTAIISNLPAYRHGKEYVEPFVDMLWGIEADVEQMNGVASISRDKLRQVFDFIITIEEPVLRGFEL